MLQTLKKLFNNFNRKLTIIKRVSYFAYKKQRFSFFWAKFQRISFDFNYNKNTFIIKIIHKLRWKFQRLIMIKI